ncbi:Ligand-binding domain of nuclear hormone receptor [Hypocenomyce scalaris]|nr:Ligand-binding domain of nuclear hormone receptor [Hypocenomyce scalaris]
MTLDGHGGLAIAEIIFYTPALIAALWVSKRHGFSRQAGWILIAILSIIRILGASFTLASESQSNNLSLIEGAAALDGVGLSPLCLAAVGILARVNAGMTRRVIPARFTTLMVLPFMVALILAIVGGVKLFSTSASERATGQHIREAAYILFLVFYLVIVVLALLTLLKIRDVSPGETCLVIAVAVSLPFLACRLIYAVIGGFSSVYSTWDPVTGSAVLMGCMAILMEFIVVILYLTAGFMAPVVPRNRVREGDLELHKPPERNGHQQPQQSEQPQQPQHQQHQHQQQDQQQQPQRPQHQQHQHQQQYQQQQPQQQQQGRSRAYRIARYTPIVHWFV